MPYPFIPDRMYRMPTHFGPAAGPRQGPGGRTFECKDNPKSTSISVSFLSNAAQLEEFLPPGFGLAGEPVVTVAASYMTEIEWLAGRGYNTLGVSFPATFRGEQDSATGSFLTVLWENLTDPILTGREELGFAKIYCELPEPAIFNGIRHVTASWLGFRFLDLYVGDLVEQTPAQIEATQRAALQATSSDGTLHYKYIPRTGEWGTEDAAYACLTPAATPNRVVKTQWKGQGTLQFHPARWEDMPTQYNIVNAFAGLEVQEYRGAVVTQSVGGKDLSDQRILR